MAELINKLNIKYSNIIDECVCYTTSDEATPKTISEGSYWEIKNNNTICYLGLWPVNENQDSGFHSKLKIKKNGIEYYVEKKVLNEFTVTIEQSEHQTIKVICNGYTYTETFKALAGSQFTVVVEPEVGYTAGKPNYSSGYVTSNITIFASYASLEAYYITLIPGNNQTLKVTLNGDDKLFFTSSFVAAYGDTYVVEIIPDEGYEAGSLISGNMNGTISENLTIQASDAEIKKYSVYVIQPDNDSNITINSSMITESMYNYGTSITAQVNNIPIGYEIDKFYLGEFPVYISQSEHQIIEVTVNGTEKFTDSFVATVEDTYKINIIPDEGYEAGEIVGDIPLSGKFNGTTRLEATEVNAKYFIVNIDQSLNQIIKVICNGKKYTNTFTAPYGSTYTATITPAEGYNAGKLLSASGTIKSNVTISATAATIKTFTVTITQSANQTIKVVCNGQTHTSTFTASYGSSYTVFIEPDVGYNAGKLNNTGGVLTGNISISATNAVIKQFTVTITQSLNQTITVKCNGQSYISSFKANYGSTYTASVSTSNSVYYIPGTISSASGTITNNITISATAATLKKYTITVTQPANGKITVNGSVGTSFIFDAGTSITVQATANSGYKVTDLNVNKTTNVLSANIENIRGNAN